MKSEIGSRIMKLYYPVTVFLKSGVSCMGWINEKMADSDFEILTLYRVSEGDLSAPRLKSYRSIPRYLIDLILPGFLEVDSLRRRSE